MMNMSSRGLRCAAIILLIGAAPTVAMAYIDPGNGAYMVQVLFTLIGAAIFYLRHPIQTLKAMWRWLIQRRKGSSAFDVKIESDAVAADELEIASQPSAVVRD